MTDCIFCKIANGEIPSDKVHENEHVMAFRDLNPQAPHHILIIPKQHISTLNDLNSDTVRVFGELGLAAKEIAKSLGVAEDGYRLVVNCNAHGGQTVFHIHMHFLAGRQLHWPPG